jgi:hypothetical protein
MGLTTEIIFLMGTEFFIYHSIRTGSGVCPSSCRMSIGGYFPRDKSGRSVNLTTNPHTVLKASFSEAW